MLCRRLSMLFRSVREGHGILGMLCGRVREGLGMLFRRVRDGLELNLDELEKDLGWTWYVVWERAWLCGTIGLVVTCRLVVTCGVVVVQEKDSLRCRGKDSLTHCEVYGCRSVK
ncbi:hypothetical protein Hamer_G031874 [Homarus americanus]|uniref:Uncharacterized protein n=1 Tax=Homarus americanus TaxID=6706 RepID=A0A8J5JW37_HOMAM|nr:hypothetical protein Hamer_G031874 [Homarus americanus]